MVFFSKSEKQTYLLGLKLAKTLKGSEVILLTGQLGSGKTVFCKGIARGLKIKEVVTSPTFSMLNLYLSGKIKLMHCDAYRLTCLEDAESVGITEYLGQNDYVCVVEWPQNIESILSDYKTINVEIKYKGETFREISIC